MSFVQGRCLVTSLVRVDPSRQPKPLTMPKPPSRVQTMPGRIVKPLSTQTMPGRISRPIPMHKPMPKPRPRNWYDNTMQWLPLPWHEIIGMIKTMESLSPEEKLKYGFIFAELLGLPEPHKRKTKDTTGDKFAVKLLNFDPDKKHEVLRTVVDVKFTEEVIYSLDELSMGPSLDALNSVPSVIKQGVSKEEANDIIAQIEAAGGVAVMEPLE